MAKDFRQRPAAWDAASVRALRGHNRDVAYCEIESNYGHDAFLVEVAEQTELIKHFLANTYKKAA